jgi:phosphohistidine swiveling domain-containing protein
MKEGSIEIWENLKATEWLESVILKKNKEDPKFIDQVLETYKNKLSEVHKLWKEKILPLNDLEKLINISREALPYFIAYYYSAVNEKTPQDIRNKALEMRNKDEFFAENDMIIRDSILSIYPEIKGYETATFFEELDSIPSMEILKERRWHSSLIQGKEKHVGDLSDLRKIHPEFNFVEEQKEATNIKEIKGQIAQKGKAVGKVKILRRRDQVGEVQEGDIIVSPMTTPDFLPAMKIAGAFVTDEGGITCHAGIVARELKKPCVIGTKIVTQVLKDGDRVEVDADKGVIKILKND